MNKIFTFQQNLTFLVPARPGYDEGEMGNILIPYEPPFAGIEPDDLLFQTQSFDRNRRSILNELRCFSGLPSVLKELSQDTVYKLSVIPDGATLYTTASGEIKGVWYKNGKILEHARFKAMYPSLVKIASAIGSQILLISIAIQLNRIEKSISHISIDLHNDRIAEIASGINQYKQAMLVHNPHRQSVLLANSILSLNTGLEKTIRSLRMQIEDAPEPQSGFMDNWLTNKSEDAEHKIRLAEESFQACIVGVRTLAKCFAVWGEPLAAASAVKEQMCEIAETGIETAAKKSRLVKCRDNALPEAPWIEFLKYNELFRNEVELCNRFVNTDFDCIEVEFKPEEMKESENENV